MSRVVAIGERRYLEGFELAGVSIIAADDPHDARAAWSGLDSDVAVAILTRAAQEAVSPVLDLHPDVIWTTLPG